MNTVSSRPGLTGWLGGTGRLAGIPKLFLFRYQLNSINFIYIKYNCNCNAVSCSFKGISFYILRCCICMRNLIHPLFTFNRQFTIDILFMNCTFQQLMTMLGYIVLPSSSSSSMNTNINFYWCLFVSYTTRRIFALNRIKQEKEDVIWLVVSSNINARTVLIEKIFMFWWSFPQLV